MRKADRETESRKLIGEKLREARMADNSPMTEEDAEYYRILAEARANHAAKENSRKSAQRHVFTSAAAILLILAVAGGSFILGMQSDVRASADPDDERKVVQQGDNIVIGSGVSGDDENVGVVTKTYYSLEDVPEDIRKEIPTLNEFDVKKIKVNKSQRSLFLDLTYNDANFTDSEILISKDIICNESKVEVFIYEQEKFQYKEIDVYKSHDGKGATYYFKNKNVIYNIYDYEEAIGNKIEDIIDDLIS